MEEPKYLPSHIANYILWRAHKENREEDITPMKLIKLVYFCYAWYLTLHEKKLFSEQVQAWKHGPVIPSIYHEFKRYGNSSIKTYSVEYDIESEKKSDLKYPIIAQDDLDTLKILDAVWENYKDKNGWELREITHQPSSPWHYAYQQGANTPLDDQHIIKRASEAIQNFLEGLKKNNSI